MNLPQPLERSLHDLAAWLHGRRALVLLGIVLLETCLTRVVPVNGQYGGAPYGGGGYGPPCPQGQPFSYAQSIYGPAPSYASYGGYNPCLSYINGTSLIDYILQAVQSSYLPVNFTDTNLSANFTANYSIPSYGASYGYNQQPAYGAVGAYASPPYGGYGGGSPYGGSSYGSALPGSYAMPYLGGALPNVPYAVQTYYGQPTVYGNGPAQNYGGYNGQGYPGAANSYGGGAPPYG